MNEKKRKILLAAMKLFSKKSFHQTSMQQIADICGLSKGSLYNHFTSKESLLSEIFTYYYQLLHDQIAVSKEEADSLQQDFIREIAIRTQHYYDFQEFFLMQVKEIQGLEDPSLNELVRKENLFLMQQSERRIIKLYGQEIVPYAADLTASLKGLMISYLREVIDKKEKHDFYDLAAYLFSQLDASAEMVMETKPVPFFQSYLKQGGQPAQKEGAHPLHMVKKLKEAAIQKNEPPIIQESIAILEKELLEVKPRQAILNGMLFNLKRSPSIHQLAEELEEAVNKASETIYV